jgi:predicted TIM-barrel fold metal-dependent hydrolase
MRDGQRIIDTDTHVGPSIETLEQFAGPALRARWDELDPFRQPSTEGGHHLSIHPYPYRRKLGTSPEGAVAAGTGGASPLKGSVSRTSLPTPYTPGVNDLNATGRLADMDLEGVDVHLIIPATFATAVSALDVELALEIYAAYHRYLEAYCSADAGRLKATMLVSGADPVRGAATIHEQSAQPHIASVTVVLPEGLPVDDPSLEPLWQAMHEHDLPLLHHSFFYEPPYFPGYRDIWGNVVIARAAAHPWGAERLTAYLILSGMFDRYPRLRIGFAECSAGWLPGWLVRLRGQAQYMKHAVPEIKLDEPLDYARAGHVFCGIELYEGETLAKAIVDVVGDGVLMYQSDYPHPGGEFPNSPKVVLGWTALGDETLRKIMCGNAERFLRM